MTNKNNIKINNIKNKTNGEPYIWASYLEETLLSDFLKYIYGVSDRHCLYLRLKYIYGVFVSGYPRLKYIYGLSVSETQIYEWVSVSKTMMSKEIKTE